MDTFDNYYLKYMKYKHKYIELKQNGGSDNNKTLYDRLGGIFAIAAVIDHFSDAVINNPIVGKGSPNPDLKKWSTNQSDRLAGLKFMRTLWVCEATGGPCTFTATVPGACHMSLEAAHEKFHIKPEEFDVVADLLKKSLKHFKVPEQEMSEVLAAFGAHKMEVTKGYCDTSKTCPVGDTCSK
jgi:hemoglobin